MAAFVQPFPLTFKETLDMLETVIKRSGVEEPADPAKINKWLTWGSASLRSRVEFSSAVTAAIARCGTKVHSQELQLLIIEELVAQGDWAHSLLAGRLYGVWLQKFIHGDRIPTVKQKMHQLLDVGLAAKMDYSEEDYSAIEGMINHERDYDMAEFQIKYIRGKYGLQNKKTGAEFETPQFVYMRMAMALAEPEPKGVRLVHLKNFYDHLSLGQISAPTPNFNNLGTPHKGLASCCVFTSGDSIASLAAGDHIAYMMTANSAGVGAFQQLRTAGDPIRNGSIIHQGKLPYNDLLGKIVKANKQGSRGGALTSYYSAFDPEVTALTMCQNPRTSDAKSIRTINFAMQGNAFLAKKATFRNLEDRKVFLFTKFSAPNLFKLFFSGSLDAFVKEYVRLELDDTFEKTYIDAREIVVTAATQGFEVGTLFFFNADEANRHTPFKDPILSSNLCLAGDTQVSLLGRSGVRTVTLEEVNKEFASGVRDMEVLSYNTGLGRTEFRRITNSAMTSPSAHVLKVTDNVTGLSITCTPDHMVWVEKEGYVRAGDLQASSALRTLKGSPNLDDAAATTVEELLDPIPVYDITVDGNHNFYANSILVHNCMEIMLPTKEYQSVMDLYLEEDHGRGEVAMCSLGALVPSNIPNDTVYRSAAYYCLKMIDYCIKNSTYPLPHIRYTAQARMSAGVGMVGIAHYLAVRNLKFSSLEGRNELHRLSEKHAFILIEQSLRLSKERGLPKWIHKTKWPEGWLPIDTYKKFIDTTVTVGLEFPWEELRAEIIANGGIGHSCLITHMPTESSSKAVGMPNAGLAARELVMLKTDGSNAIDWVARDSDLYGDNYELAYSIDTEDLFKVYGIYQKFSDQGVSADEYADRSKDQNLYASRMVQNYVNMFRYGMKSRYYANSNVSAKNITAGVVDDFKVQEAEPEERGCGGGGCTV